MKTVTSPPSSTTARADAWRAGQLAALLKRCRARVTPDASPFQPRRTPGLTQAHLAQLLCVDERHYRDFERGRVRRPEPAFLDRLAVLLGMTPGERHVVYHLARGHGPASTPPGPTNLTELQRLIDALPGQPAIVTDMAWNALLWNQSNVSWFGAPESVRPEERNAMLWMFTREARERVPDVEAEYPHLVGRVKATFLCDRDADPKLRDLVRRLLRIPQAAALWEHATPQLEPALLARTVHHPDHGPTEMQSVGTLIHAQGLRLIVHTPIPAQRTAPTSTGSV